MINQEDIDKLYEIVGKLEKFRDEYLESENSD